MSHNNFGSSESIVMTLFPVDVSQSGVITRVQFSECPAPKICESEKMSKIRRNVWQLSTLIAIIFGTDHHVESLKIPLSTTNPSTLGPKMVNFGPQTTELNWLILTNPSGHFSRDYILAIRGCCPLNFLHALAIDPGYLAHTPNAMGFPPHKILIVKI